MPSVSVEAVKVSQALNELGPVKRSQAKFADLQYITKWALMNNVAKIYLDSSDLIFLNGALGVEEV